MKQVLVVLVLSTCTDANAHIIMSTKPMIIEDVTVAKPYIAVQMSPEERAWRRAHPEIPNYAPYTPDYGWHYDRDRPYFRGTPNPYRNQYPQDCRTICYSDGVCVRQCR